VSVGTTHVIGVDDNRGVKLTVTLVLAVAALAAAPLAAAARGPHGGCVAGAERHVGSPTASYAALARASVEAYRQPGRSPFVDFPHVNVNGYQTTFNIVGAITTRACDPTWYRVQLPIRPNGVTGYVRARDVDVVEVRTRIEVDLSRRTLILWRAGRKVLETRVGIGTPATPTPVGRFYVSQRLVPADPSGPYGPAALGVSAYSPVLTGWVQGGPIGIHGTDKPWLLGRAVSNGCIRVENAVIERLFAATPGGTPVVIHP